VVLEKDGDQLSRPCEKCEVLHRLKEARNILHTVRRKKANWTGHICLLKHVIERNTERKDRNDGKVRKKT
jgi:hypothetical protein